MGWESANVDGGFDGMFSLFFDIRPWNQSTVFCSFVSRLLFQWAENLRPILVGSPAFILRKLGFFSRASCSSHFLLLLILPFSLLNVYILVIGRYLRRFEVQIRKGHAWLCRIWRNYLMICYFCDLFAVCNVCVIYG